MTIAVAPTPEASVRVDVPRPHVALVTLNRPAARNAINAEAARALDGIVRSLEADPEIWVVVLTGAGGQAFCAGADLKEVAAGGIERLWTDAGFAGFVNSDRTKPWIAAVDGLALAGGCELALACDLIVASDDAAFGVPEVTRGLLPAAGGAYRLPRALPRAVAMELIATGARLSAERALAFGMVNRVVPKATTLEAALDLAAVIAANAPIAVREALEIARRSYDLDDRTLCRMSLEAQDRITRTEDFQEGPRAFIEKRAPRWTGR